MRREAVLVVGAGTNDTRTTIQRHEALAEVAGVAASLAVVPYYVRPSEAAIVRHFQAVAARSPVPLIAYNIPYRTGRGLGADALLELAATANIAGVKQAVGCIDADTLRVLSESGGDFALLGGDDAFLFPLMLMGARGAIAASANLCTRRFVEMIDCGLRREVEEGRGHAEALLPLVQALFAEPSPAVIKALLHASGRIPTAAVRMPLADASPQAAARAVEALSARRALTLVSLRAAPRRARPWHRPGHRCRPPRCGGSRGRRAGSSGRRARRSTGTPARRA